MKTMIIVVSIFFCYNYFSIKKFSSQFISFLAFLQPSDPDLATERDVFMYRAYLALQKFVIVKDEIGANSPQLIQPLKVIIDFPKLK